MEAPTSKTNRVDFSKQKTAPLPTPRLWIVVIGPLCRGQLAYDLVELLDSAAEIGGAAAILFDAGQVRSRLPEPFQNLFELRPADRILDDHAST
jgi:hypothetical protein